MAASMKIQHQACLICMLLLACSLCLASAPTHHHQACCIFEFCVPLACRLLHMYLPSPCRHHPKVSEPTPMAFSFACPFACQYWLRNLSGGPAPSWSPDVAEDTRKAPHPFCGRAEHRPSLLRHTTRSGSLAAPFWWAFKRRLSRMVVSHAADGNMRVKRLYKGMFSLPISARPSPDPWLHLQRTVYRTRRQ